MDVLLRREFFKDVWQLQRQMLHEGEWFFLFCALQVFMNMMKMRYTQIRMFWASINYDKSSAKGWCFTVHVHWCEQHDCRFFYSKFDQIWLDQKAKKLSWTCNKFNKSYFCCKYRILLLFRIVTQHWWGDSSEYYGHGDYNSSPELSAWRIAIWLVEIFPGIWPHSEKVRF